MVLRRVVLPLTTVLLLALATSCPKSRVTSSVPAAPTLGKSSKPVIAFFSSEPNAVTAGKSVSLRWSVTGAQRVQIDNGLGTVESSGSRQMQLNGSTTYKLEATNAAGTASAVLTVNVIAPLSSGTESPDGRSGAKSFDLLATQLQDIHFNYDKEEIPAAEKSIIDRDALVLKNLIASDPGVVVIIEGHCDERGSAEYNIALGDRRANVVKNLFVHSGLPENKFNTISYGKEQPVCLSTEEDCLARNRRVHFTPSK